MQSNPLRLWCPTAWLWMIAVILTANPAGTVRGAENPASTNTTYIMPATGPIIYENIREWAYELRHYYFPIDPMGNETTNEFGDEITFAPTGKDGQRTLGMVQFEYYLSRFVSGKETLQFRLYDNSGLQDSNGHRTPGVVLYDSGIIPISAHNGYQTLKLKGLNLRNVPDSVTWTVQFEGLSPGANVGIICYAPPGPGQSFDDFWEKQDGVWATKRFSHGGAWLANFGFQASAHSEPGPPTLLWTPLHLDEDFSTLPPVPPVPTDSQPGFDPTRDGLFHRLTLEVNPIDCGQITIGPYVNAEYPHGTLVTIGSNPAPGYDFRFWAGDVTGTNIPMTLVMDADKNVTANFVAQPPAVVRIRTEGPKIAIEWTGSGILQNAPTITGPWSDAQNLWTDTDPRHSPYPINKPLAPTFYRVRSGY